MSKRLNIVIPDALYEQIEALVKASPRALRLRKSVTPTAVVREALARGVESLEREAKQEGRE
ncbi:MAG: hypothetical protein M3Z21_15270 [Pseudomonadota bacterium]|nr:hypothetical protein [Pseudomonadota bacterium]